MRNQPKPKTSRPSRKSSVVAKRARNNGQGPKADRVSYLPKRGF